MAAKKRKAVIKSQAPSKPVKTKGIKSQPASKAKAVARIKSQKPSGTAAEGRRRAVARGKY